MSADSRPKRVFVASSWFQRDHTGVVDRIRKHGFEVADYRNPPGEDPVMFRWAAYDINDRVPPIAPISIGTMRNAHCFSTCAREIAALMLSDALVLIHPAGVSSAVLYGYARAHAIPAAVLMIGDPRPEVMLAGADLITESQIKLIEWLMGIPEPERSAWSPGEGSNDAD